ncbi:MAG: pyridoxamine 5'-phosphate oxidase family protein [Eubacteriaceae bacterium]|nr:pyridoxamine 5'-phosphate oxidase family protein [Eubacteriaceae bacterium]
MRRKDRQVDSFDDIVGILDRADTIRVGFNGDPYPYVVALSFGYRAENRQISIYFHGAKAGYKHELIKQNPNVCVQADILHGYIQDKGSYSALYESFTGFGEVKQALGDEALQGLDLLLEHCGFEAAGSYSETELEATLVYKIELNSYTAKRNLR